MAHIPWLFTYLRLFPVIKIRQRMFDLVGAYVNRRLAEGSNAKDLMYYLVSKYFSCFFAVENRFLMPMMRSRLTKQDWNQSNPRCLPSILTVSLLLWPVLIQ
jgi:hypothetical protein